VEEADMESTFYDSKGTPIAYTEDRVHIYLYSGERAAYLSGNSVYSFSGIHLGWFEDGWIRDTNGDCVFFTDKAKGGPMKPLKSLKPLKNLKHLKPSKSPKEPTPRQSRKSRSWSELSGKHFFDI
jgi:hypothetical protein